MIYSCHSHSSHFFSPLLFSSTTCPQQSKPDSNPEEEETPKEDSGPSMSFHHMPNMRPQIPPPPVVEEDPYPEPSKLTLSASIELSQSEFQSQWRSLAQNQLSKTLTVPPGLTETKAEKRLQSIQIFTLASNVIRLYAYAQQDWPNRRPGTPVPLLLLELQLAEEATATTAKVKIRTTLKGAGQQFMDLVQQAFLKEEEE